MALEEVVNQLETYDSTDFNNTATFEPASPLCITQVFQHKDETYSANGSQPRKHIIKTGWQTQAEKIMEVLNELFGDNDARRVLISDTLSADMNFSLPAGMSTPDNILQIFVIGESLPCFVVTLYNALKKNANPGDQKEQIHKFTVSTIKRLKSSLLNFCHDEFAILPCTLDMQNFDKESLKQELQMREDKCQQFYDGPIRLETTVFKNLAQAAVLQQGTSCVPCFMPTSFKGCDTDEEWLILLDEKWRNIVQLLIVAMTHTGQSSVRISCRSALKMEVAILETAFRVGRSQLVNIKSSNAEVNDCVTKLITKGKCNARLEQSGELDGSFQVISQQSTLTFKEIKGIATVTLTANQDLTSVEDGMDKTLVGNKIETSVTLPVSKEMTSVEDESEAEIDERQNVKDKGVATVTAVIKDSGRTEDAVRRDDHTEKYSIEEVETATRPASEEDIRTTRKKPETRDVGIQFLYQAPKPCHSKACSIVGMPQNSFNESDEELREKVCNLFVHALKLPVTGREILTIKRLGKINDEMLMTGQPREICVVFASKEDRDNVLEKRWRLRCGGPWIEEYLPLQKYHLLLEARRSFGFEHAWSENGVVHVELHDRVFVPINSSNHLSHIIKDETDKVMLQNYHLCKKAAPCIPYGPQRITRPAQYSPPQQSRWPIQPSVYQAPSISPQS